MASVVERSETPMNIGAHLCCIQSTQFISIFLQHPDFVGGTAQFYSTILQQSHQSEGPGNHMIRICSIVKS